MIDKILGPQVAIVDNDRNEIQSIEVLLNELNIGNKFYEVDYLEPIYPEHPIETVELVFLDLYYNPVVNVDFDPYACSYWLTRIVPADKNYILVVWSKDTHQTEYLLDIMREMGAPIPFLVETKSKPEYQLEDREFDIKRLLEELNIGLEKSLDISYSEFYGQIVAIEEGSVLINCLILNDPQVFEVRRFDLKPFKGIINLEKKVFVKIKITNKLGTKIFEFFEIKEDMSSLFEKDDDFSDIGDLDFLQDKDN